MPKTRNAGSGGSERSGGTDNGQSGSINRKPEGGDVSAVRGGNDAVEGVRNSERVNDNNSAGTDDTKKPETKATPENRKPESGSEQQESLAGIFNKGGSDARTDVQGETGVGVSGGAVSGESGRKRGRPRLTPEEREARRAERRSPGADPGAEATQNAINPGVFATLPVADLLKTSFNLLSVRLGDFWKLTDEEAQALGKAAEPVLEKYLGKFMLGPEAALIVTAVVIVGPRIMQTFALRAKARKEKEEKELQPKQPEVATS